MAIQLIDALHADASLEMDGDKLRVAQTLQNRIAAGVDMFASSHPDSEDFNGTPDAMPAGWAFYSSSTAGTGWSNPAAILAPGAPVVGVDPYVNNVLSGNNLSGVSYNVNSRRPSWWFHKIPGESGGFTRWAVCKRQASDLPADATIVCRFMMHGKNGGGGENINGFFRWGMCGDAASLPVEGTSNVQMTIWPNTLSSVFEVSVNSRNGAGTGTAAKTIAGVSVAYPIPEYLKIVRRAGSIYGYVGWSGGSWNLVGIIANAGALRWWYLTTFSRNDGSDHNPYPYVGVDWMRRWDTADAVL